MAGTVLAGQPLTSSLLGCPVWSAMTLLNSWVNFGSGWVTAQYRMWPLTNWVEIIGEVESGTITNGTGIWQAPAGYIPISEQAVCALCIDGNSGGSASQFTPRLVINTSGLLFMENVPTGTTSFGWHGLYGLDS